MKELIIATNSVHKVEEFKKMLAPLNITVKSLLDVDDTIEIEENGSTFEENAIIKAEYLSNLLNQPCIADDSGLEIYVLNNEPGIYSARYMGQDTSYDLKNKALIERVSTFNDRRCRFVCVIALASPGQDTRVFRGVVAGEVAKEISGVNGFGYDPIFYYPPLKKTLAEIDDNIKNTISHRYNALKQVIEYLTND